MIVVSDHGYSTIISSIEVEAMVREAGFPPGDSPGGVVVAPNGGSVLFYVHDKDRATADKLCSVSARRRMFRLGRGILAEGRKRGCCRTDR